MTTQEFLQNLDASSFSDHIKEDIRAAVGGATEFTPALKATVLALMQTDIELDLAGVPMDSAEVQQIEKDLENSLEQIEKEAQQDVEAVEREVRELADMSQKVDVLERLHS
jgi:hypothetical protein